MTDLTKMCSLTKGIILLSQVMQEIERGSPRWEGRGGQSHGWKVLRYIEQRYQVPRDSTDDIVFGLLRAA